MSSAQLNNSLAVTKDTAPMLTLDPLNFPLHGSSLIEASAGTGKTYTIVNLYLRLLLGRGCKPFGIEQILVVTFTNAATAELKERIRARLRQTYLDFYAGKSKDKFIQNLLDNADDLAQDCQRLALAIKQMDEAAVFTIHGFSQKALTEHAFESGALYQQQFIMDESDWLQLAVEDYWRKYVATKTGLHLQLLLSCWPGPDALLTHIRSYIYRDVQVTPQLSIESCASLIGEYQQQVIKAKRYWVEQQIDQQLLKANLNGRANLSKLDFLKQMTGFCLSDAFIPTKKIRWSEFTPEKIEKALKKASSDLSHIDFSLFERLAELQVKCEDAIKVTTSEQAIGQVRQNLSCHKNRLLLLSPDDLLQGLNRALMQKVEGASPLAEKLASSYPVALIDEFQDTDPVQYQSFKAIYGDSEKGQRGDLCWIMIGDPKQAIYGFRGADIYTYIDAKQWVAKDRQYTLATNWRSSPALIQSVNQLFASSQKGFLFEQSIPFTAVEAGREYGPLVINEQKLSPLHFQHFTATDSLSVSSVHAKSALASQCAGQVAKWLNLATHGKAVVEDKVIQAGDICILVRDRIEANLIKHALFKVKVDSVFLARQSVFETQLAQDLLRLLKALHHPNEEKLLKTALITELFGFTASELETLFNDDLRWQSLLDLRYEWNLGWKKHGLMHVVNQVLAHFSIEQRLLRDHGDGHRRITDLHHLVELLQQHSLLLVGEGQLLHWFEAAILHPEPNSESQQLRVESDENLVQIVTLHASKGLEFPLVFLPFGVSFRNQKHALYHNDEQQLEVDFLASDKAIQQAEFERLAEDIRLFYVAVTRAVHYCYIGIWNCALGKSTKSSAIQQSALGHLLLAENPPSAAEQSGALSDQHIQQAIERLKVMSDISYEEFSEYQEGESFQALQNVEQAKLACMQVSNPILRNWRLTSYSALSRQQVAVTDELDSVSIAGFDEVHTVDEITINDQPIVEQLTPFTFEKGANAGSFLHEVLENIDFQCPDNLAEVIQQKRTKFAIADDNQDMLVSWIRCVLNASMCVQSQTGLSLSALAPRQIKVEMEFHIPLKTVHVAAFNQVINQYYPDQRREYQFEPLNGMLKGFIDLTFEYQGRFYVADYKSNYLGPSQSSYDQQSMAQVMQDHDYQLQGILYSLALHRWLKNMLVNYDYDSHVGGAYYLFLRGMNEQSPEYGVYFFKVAKGLIQALDTLFDGKTPTASLSTPELCHDEQPPEQENQQGQLGLW